MCLQLAVMHADITYDVVQPLCKMPSGRHNCCPRPMQVAQAPHRRTQSRATEKHESALAALLMQTNQLHRASEFWTLQRDMQPRHDQVAYLMLAGEATKTGPLPK